MHASNWKKKPLEVLKRIKTIFIDVIGEKFAMSIRWRKLSISFCIKLFSCINYLELLK